MLPKFYKSLGPISYKDLSKIIEIENYSKDHDHFEFNAFCGNDYSCNNDLTFILDKKDIDLPTISAGGILCSNNINFKSYDEKKIIIKVKDLHNSIAIISNKFYREFNILEINHQKKSIIGKTKYKSNSSIIQNGCIIGKNLQIEDGAIIKHSCIIGDNVFIGANSVIQNTIIGDNVKIESNCSIGQPGFGFAYKKGYNNKIFHIGRVIIQNNSYIGSNCTIDRGSFSDTQIGENVYLDNLVHVAHNVCIGSDCIIAGQVGIAGSTKIGNRVRIGGQSGIIGHIKIGDNVDIAAKSGVRNDIASNLKIMGDPAINMFTYLKNYKKQNKIL